MKTSSKLETIAAIPFFGSLGFLGQTYGWKLPICLFLFFIGTEIQKASQREKEKGD